MADFARFYLVYNVATDAYDGWLSDRDRGPPSEIGEYCVPVSERTMRALGCGFRVPDDIGRAKLHEKFIRDLDAFVSTYPATIAKVA